MAATRFLPRLARGISATRIAAKSGVLGEEAALTSEQIVEMNKQGWQELTRSNPSAATVFEPGKSLSGREAVSYIGHGGSRSDPIGMSRGTHRSGIRQSPRGWQGWTKYLGGDNRSKWF
jgi:hypothetical protein